MDTPPWTPCAQCDPDDLWYCPVHNPLGGSYARINAELEAQPVQASRQRRISHEGFYGHRYRRPRMDRRRIGRG